MRTDRKGNIITTINPSDCDSVKSIYIIVGDSDSDSEPEVKKTYYSDFDTEFEKYTLSESDTEFKK